MLWVQDHLDSAAHKRKKKEHEMISAFLQRTSGKSHTDITPQSTHPDTTSILQESEVPWQDDFANTIVNVNQEIKSLSLHSGSDHGFGSDSSDGSAGGLVQDLDDIDALDLFGESVPMPVVSKEEVVANNHLWSPFGRFLSMPDDGISTQHHTFKFDMYLARIRKLLNFELKETISVWNNKCYSISLKGILANYLKYYPHDPSGTTINSLYQCFKWREDLSRELRVQMVAIGSNHFYIFEPNKLSSGDVVVPVFFYKLRGDLHAKCYQPQYWQKSDGSLEIHMPAHIKFNDNRLLVVNIEEFSETYSQIYMEDGILFKDICLKGMTEVHQNGMQTTIPLPNPWRDRAAGRIIRHVPIHT
ncbi:hypothetical protein KEM48_012377 [Puccinia striiformis f. sp. tritici PST-130]|uniref:Uncharacterized protein n=1 Tax=Puccinia striiformis f. sp. tritici PST-78 TaxID=1165861 RepID=A0A0L0VCB4_9BASI|nr:hypothetical protein KEM48_012377 [Puccinia striiformis f. sp. tritici PST-130]KNE96925.1 hypothetical protein PSTG_09794 [Puccinia striiformis f. sp. tritici PST-78]